MASRYVCNFDEVRKQADIICQAAKDMDQDIKDYVANVTDHLSGWGGTSAKKAFEITDDKQVEITNTHVKEIDEVGVFIKEAVDMIEKVENGLAGMKI